jgi:hypothetical protein
MVNETQFTDNSSQWQLYRKNPEGYKSTLASLIAARPERSHGFRFRGQYEEQVPAVIQAAEAEQQIPQA